MSSLGSMPLSTRKLIETAHTKRAAYCTKFWGIQGLSWQCFSTCVKRIDVDKQQAHFAFMRRYTASAARAISEFGASDREFTIQEEVEGSEVLSRETNQPKRVITNRKGAWPVNTKSCIYYYPTNFTLSRRNHHARKISHRLRRRRQHGRSPHQKAFLPPPFSSPTGSTSSMPDPARQDYLRQTYGIRPARDLEELCGASGILVLAVKPQVLPAVLDKLRPLLSRKPLVVSIAAGISLATLTGTLPEGTPVIRRHAQHSGARPAGGFRSFPQPVRNR